MNIPGSNIRLLREQMGLSQRALANAADIDIASLSRLESGKAGYSRESIERIAHVLAVSVGVLFADNAVVEAAALRMRRIPLLTPEQLMKWPDPDCLLADSQQVYLHEDLQRASRHCFALRIGDQANKPHFSPGDELIFDASKSPKMGRFVAATDGEGKLYLGRFQELVEPFADGPAFGVVPYDTLYLRATSSEIANLRLRGSLIGIRKYVA